MKNRLRCGVLPLSLVDVFECLWGAGAVRAVTSLRPGGQVPGRVRRSYVASQSLSYLLCKVGSVWCLFHRIIVVIKGKVLSTEPDAFIDNQPIKCIY